MSLTDRLESGCVGPFVPSGIQVIGHLMNHHAYAHLTGTSDVFYTPESVTNGLPVHFTLMVDFSLPSRVSPPERVRFNVTDNVINIIRDMRTKPS